MGDNVVSTLREALQNAFSGFVQMGAPTQEKAVVGEAARSQKIPTVETPTSFIDVDQFYNMLRQSATVSDPTAAGGALSPLTNTVLNEKTGLAYAAGNWIADFQGAGGKPPTLSYEFNPTSKEFVVVDSRTKTQVVILGDPKNPQQYQVVDYNTALNTILAPYRAQKGGIDALKLQLVKRGAWTAAAAKKSIGEDRAFSNALLKIIDDMSRTNFTSGMTQRLFAPFTSFLTGTAAGSLAGTKTSTGYFTTLTNEKAATDEISTFIKQYLDRGATAPEINAYKSALTKFEQEHPEKVVATVVTDATGTEKTRRQTRTVGGATETDKQAIMVGVMLDSLKKTGYNVDEISQSGGLLARGMDAIKKQAADYGVQIDDKSALNSVLDAIKQGGSVETEKEKIKQKAKLQYKNLNAAIDAGLTVADVADQYNQIKQKTLETVSPLNVLDPDIQTALNNKGKNQIMNLNDWTVYLRNKPEWGMTMNAREEAANWIKSLGREFGVLE